MRREQAGRQAGRLIWPRNVCPPAWADVCRVVSSRLVVVTLSSYIHLLLTCSLRVSAVCAWMWISPPSSSAVSDFLSCSRSLLLFTHPPRPLPTPNAQAQQPPKTPTRSRALQPPRAAKHYPHHHPPPASINIPVHLHHLPQRREASLSPPSSVSPEPASPAPLAQTQQRPRRLRRVQQEAALSPAQNCHLRRPLRPPSPPRRCNTPVLANKIHSLAPRKQASE